MQSVYDPQQTLYIVTVLFWKPGWLGSTIIYSSVEVVISARKEPPYIIHEF